MVSAAEARFIKETGAAAEIASLAEPVLESLGFRLVLVRIMGGSSAIVEIMAERPDGTMSIEDCKTVSLGLSPVLDVHDPLPTSYRLQISSPGIDRPLVRASDFDQWAGYEAKLETRELIDGRRRFRGILEGFEGGEVRIEVDLGKDLGRQVIGLPLALLADARLVLTEELVRESLRRARKGAGSTGAADASANAGEGVQAEDGDGTGPQAARRTRPGSRRIASHKGRKH